MTSSQNAPQKSDEKQTTTKRTARRGRPVGDREGKRLELLRAGIAVISDEGYAGTSLRKVAKRAGYTTGAVTYYFENKEALVAAIIEHLFDEWDTMLDLGPDAYDIGKRYEKWLALSTNSEVWSAQFQLLAHARHEPTFAEIYERRYARYREGMTAILERQQAEGSVRDDIPANLLADCLGAIGDGWMMMLPLEPHRFSDRRIEQLIASIKTLLAPEHLQMPRSQP